MFHYVMTRVIPTPSTLVFDWGATTDKSRPASNFSKKLYAFQHQIVQTGIDDACCPARLCSGPHFTRGSPGPLPYENKQFGIVFSSAVLEYMKSKGAQRQFIDETLRAGKRIFFGPQVPSVPANLPLSPVLPNAASQVNIRRYFE